MKPISRWYCALIAAALVLASGSGHAAPSAAPAPDTRPALGTEGKAAVRPDPDQTSRISVSGILCPTQDSVALQLYNNAIELTAQEKLAEAEAQYRMAIARDAGYCDAMDNLGLLMRRQGRIDEAVTWYQRSLKIKPDNGVAHQNLAAGYQAQGNLEDAQAEYVWLTEHQPGNPEGFYGLGACLLGGGRLDDAIARLEVAERLYAQIQSPLTVDAKYLLGVAHLRKNELSRARSYLLQVYPQASEEPKLNYLLGLCYLDPEGGDQAKAAEYLQKAKKLGVPLPPEVEGKLK
ncbi:tetratricopeptide repeat protein [Geomesophilobacter sediminis]|uniref:Tetratricopeptide repeat protein n=1 Tax=Geomesophilobacter sediminis TaxID=2798584 RepID=A0A8J7M2F5_9BACT|nr:tetratricopeptide repeat protein [Geomesophilobacter sediminis]MBJ6727378.1 tetratricopeptide repeat protein [Geomesophilobacter sediminis]